ncbi:MAG TPA: nuclear transport factor 2 family protein [Actinomycetota bacterium]|nr:nuclear transport factor 2 family protein [Actinomycetota bacterium]
MSDTAEVVRHYWDRIEARDWDGAGTLLADDVEVEWRHTLERFRGRENVVGYNREYPEGWSIEVLRVLDAGPIVVSEVRVPFRDEAVFYVASFFEIRDGLIRRAVEYWVEAGQEEPPEWRRAFGERLDRR